MLDALKRLIRSNHVIGPLATRLYLALHPLHARNAAYDRETIEVMHRVLRADSCCLDIGAHQGSVLKDIVAIAPNGRHYAFEPIPTMAAQLRLTYPGVTVMQAAVSDKAGTATFQHVTSDPGYSGLRRRIYDRADVEVREITVDVVRVDDVMPQDWHVAFIKLDIEGGEYHALRGAEQTIKRCRPVIVFEAGEKSTGQYGVTPEALFGFFSEIGYKLSTMEHWLTRPSPYTRETFSTNWRSGREFYFVAYP